MALNTVEFNCLTPLRFKELFDSSMSLQGLYGRRRQIPKVSHVLVILISGGGRGTGGTFALGDILQGAPFETEK